jgi:hypothetical protein
MARALALGSVDPPIREPTPIQALRDLFVSVPEWFPLPLLDAVYEMMRADGDLQWASRGSERARAASGIDAADRELVAALSAFLAGPSDVIRSTGRIPESLSGLEVKYFSATPEGAASYARQAVRGFGDAPYTLVETQVPRSALPADVLLQVDRNVPAVVLPNTHLPLLGPANVWPFMPVP